MNLAGLDALRARALGTFGPAAPSLLRDRERRIAVSGAAAIVAALVLARVAPGALLALGPIVLGVPHLVADVRYLVARPGLHRRSEVWLFVLGPAALAFFLPHAWLGAGVAALAALVARAPLVRRVAAAALAAGAAVVAGVHERVADLAMAHAHNAIAVLLFWAWASRRRWHAHVVAGAFLAGLALIAAGALDAAPIDLGGDVAERLAPVAEERLALRLVLGFAFAQSVHYAVWVRLVPDADRPRPGLRSFRSTLRALEGDLGRPLVALAVVTLLGLAGWALVALSAARDGYLRLAAFHGPLELGTATLLLLERGRLGAEKPSTPGLS